MKVEIRLFIKTFLISGLIFAGIMAGVEYFGNQEISIIKFLIHFFGFGLCMGFVAIYNHKKQMKRKTKKE